MGTTKLKGKLATTATFFETILLVAISLSLVLLAGSILSCDSSVGPTPGPEGITFITELPAGADVAELQTDLPSGHGLSKLVIKGTVPIVPGVYPRPDNKKILCVEVGSQNSVPAQMEIVSRYPDATDSNGVAAGADVVEVIAEVPPNASGTYKVRSCLTSYPDVPTGLSAREVLLRTGQLPNAVKSLLDTEAPLIIEAVDENNCKYDADILAAVEGYKIEKSGPLMNTVRANSFMEPTGSCATGHKPQLFGIHAFISTIAGYDGFMIDLNVHNGVIGDESHPAIGNAYFTYIKLNTPSGFSLLNAVNDPYFRNGNLVDRIFNTDVTNSPNVCYQGVNESNDLHVLPATGGIMRRLALPASGGTTLAQAYLKQYGQAFAKRGSSSSGSEYFSWWNKDTGRYFPQAQRLPRMDRQANAITTIRNKIHSDYLGYLAARQTGCRILAPNQNSPLGPSTNLLGHALPLGANYGGETSGLGINLLEGLGTLQGASREGVLLEQLQVEMVESRNFRHLYQDNGEPFDPYKYSVTHEPYGLVTRKYRNFWLSPFEGNGSANWAFNRNNWQMGVGAPGVDPFYDWFAARAIQPNPGSRRPGYQSPYIGLDTIEANGKGFERIDSQHQIRATRLTKALTWISNDPLAKFLVRRNGALSIGTFDYRNSMVGMPSMSGGQADSMIDQIADVANVPNSGDPASSINHAVADFQKGEDLFDVSGNGFLNQGASFGREYSWHIDIAAAAYRIESPSKRSNYLKWFKVLTQLVYAGVSQCNGLMQRGIGNKGAVNISGDGQFMLLLFGEGFIQAAMTSVWKSVWLYTGSPYLAKIKSTIAASTKGAFTSAWSFEHGNNPWYILGLSEPFPLDGNGFPIVPSFQSSNFHLYYFEGFAGPGSPPEACSGPVVPAGTDAPIHPDCSLAIPGTCTSQSDEIEPEELRSGPAFGYYATNGAGFNYLAPAAKMTGAYQSGLTQQELAQRIKTNLWSGNNMQPIDIDEFFFSFSAALLSLTEEMTNDM